MEATPDADPAAEQQVQLTVLQQVAQLAVKNGIYPQDDLPEWMQESYVVLEKWGQEREEAARRLGVTSVGQSFTVESVIANKLIRSLTKSGQLQEPEAQSLRKALAAEGEALAGILPFREKEMPVSAPPQVASVRPPKKKIGRASPPSEAQVKREVPRKRSTGAQRGSPPIWRPVLRSIDDTLKHLGLEAADYLDDRSLKFYTMLTKTDKPPIQIMQELGYSPHRGNAGTMQHRIAQQLLDRVPGVLDSILPDLKRSKPTIAVIERESLRSALKGIDTLLERHGIDPATLLTAKSLQLYRQFVKTDRSDKDIRQEFGLRSCHGPRRQLIRSLMRKAPFLLAFPEPKSPSTKSPPIKPRRPKTHSRLTQQNGDKARNSRGTPGPEGGKTGVNKAGRPAYAREALRHIDILFKRRDINPAEFMTERQLKCYVALVETEKNRDQIFEEAGYPPERASIKQYGILDRLRQKAVHILGFPIPPELPEGGGESSGSELSSDRQSVEQPWAANERLEVVRGLGTLVTEQQIDVRAVLGKKAYEIFTIMTNPALSTEGVRSQANKVSRLPLSTHSWKILNCIIERVPAEKLQLSERRRAAIQALTARRSPDRPATSPGITMRDVLLQIDRILRARADAGECEYPEELLTHAPELHQKVYPLLLDTSLTMSALAQKIGIKSKDDVRAIIESLLAYLPKTAPQVLLFKPPFITLAELGEEPPASTELYKAAREPWLRGERRNLMPHLYQRLMKLGVNPADLLSPFQLPIFEMLAESDMSVGAITEQLGFSSSVVRVQMPKIIDRCIKAVPPELLNLPALRHATRLHYLNNIAYVSRRYRGQVLSCLQRLNDCHFVTPGDNLIL